MKVKNRLDEFYEGEGLVLEGVWIGELLGTIQGMERKTLEEIVTELKQMDGEHWAVGEVLQRIIYFLGNTKGFD